MRPNEPVRIGDLIHVVETGESPDHFGTAVCGRVFTSNEAYRVVHRVGERTNDDPDCIRCLGKKT